MDLHLRAITKSTVDTELKVRSLNSEDIKEDPKLIDTWTSNIDELHESKPRPNVIYTRRMPDIEVYIYYINFIFYKKKFFVCVFFKEILLIIYIN